MSRQDYYSQNITAVIIDSVAAVDFAEGTCVTIEAGGDQASINKGADGAKTSLAFDETGMVTVSLKPTSSTNDQYAGIATKQRSGTFPDLTCTVQDGSGATHTGTGGSLVTLASVPTGSGSMEAREWKFQFEKLTIDAG